MVLFLECLIWMRVCGFHHCPAVWGAAIEPTLAQWLALGRTPCAPALSIKILWGRLCHHHPLKCEAQTGKVTCHPARKGRFWSDPQLCDRGALINHLPLTLHSRGLTKSAARLNMNSPPGPLRWGPRSTRWFQWAWISTVIVYLSGGIFWSHNQVHVAFW